MASNATFCSSCGAQVGQNRVVQGQAVLRRPSSAEIADKAKVASQDAMEALKLFATNPTGGLAPAFENLDRQRALGASLAFAVIFNLCVLFGFYRMIANARTSLGILGYYGWGLLPQSPSIIKLLPLGFVPFVSIAAALALARLVFRGTGSWEGDAFTAGASLLPFGVFVLVSGLLGFGNVEVVAVLLLFAICYTILIIFTGCTRIAKISDAGAALAVPIILLASVYLSKVIFTSMWSAGMAG
jgi:hypothetical protein